VVRRQAQVGSREVGKQGLLARTSVAMTFVAVGGGAAEQLVAGVFVRVNLALPAMT
jgi:hypothetical protein